MKSNGSLYFRRDRISLNDRDAISFTYLHTEKITDDAIRLDHQSFYDPMPQGIATEFMRDFWGIKLAMGEQVRISKKDLVGIVQKV